jgi:hypothetical protein
MTRVWKILMVAALVVGGSTAFGAGVASASTADSYSCTFSGLAGTTSDKTGDVGVESLFTDAAVNIWGSPKASANLLDVDTGKYTLDAAATCVVGSTGDTGHSGPTTAHMYSSGTYANTVCGWTDFHAYTQDPSYTQISFDNGAPTVDSVALHIYAAGGSGRVFVQSARNTGDGQILSGNGYTSIAPSTGNCATTDVQQWTLVGAFSIAGATP